MTHPRPDRPDDRLQVPSERDRATATETVLDVNIRTRHLKKLSGWRKLYLRVLERLQPASLVEFGCGRVDFLAQVPADVRRVGLDGNPELAAEFADAGIEFHAFDFDRETPPALDAFDVAVCSDVFEHLLYPATLLDHIADALAPEGVLLSHVPNEFRLDKMLRIMRGREESVVFHTDTEEWSNPHLRRFTDRGYRRFLARRFEHGIPLTHLNPPRGAARIQRLGLAPPFCLQGGPTYASTRSRETADRLRSIVRELESGRRR